MGPSAWGASVRVTAGGWEVVSPQSGPTAVASVQCGRQPGDGGLAEVPLHQGWEWPGMAPGSGISATFSSRQWSLKPRPWGGDGAVQAAELQETAGGFCLPVAGV